MKVYIVVYYFNYDPGPGVVDKVFANKIDAEKYAEQKTTREVICEIHEEEVIESLNDLCYYAIL